MIRVILTYLTLVFFPSISFICDWKYPINNEYYNELWDILKHELLFLWGILVVSISLFKVETSFQDKLVSLGCNTLIFGMIIPCMIDTYGKDREIHWWDFLFAGLAYYMGMYKFLPTWHKTLGVSFINLITLGLVNGGTFYEWICQKLR